MTLRFKALMQKLQDGTASDADNIEIEKLSMLLFPDEEAEVPAYPDVAPPCWASRLKAASSSGNSAPQRFFWKRKGLRRLCRRAAFYEKLLKVYFYWIRREWESVNA